MATRAFSLCVCFLLCCGAFADFRYDPPAGASREVDRSDWVLVGNPDPEQVAVAQRYRDEIGTLKMLFESRALLGDHFYSIACHAGDISEELSIERFRRGVNAAHYSARQVTVWANQHKFGAGTPHPLINILLETGFLEEKMAVYWDTGKFRHLVAATEGRKRSLERNIVHETLHVRYDEDPLFRKEIEQGWSKMSERERKAFAATLKSYDTSQEAQVMEEWGVRQAEKLFFEE